MIITTLNIHRGFKYKVRDIIKEFNKSDIITLQETGLISDQDISDLEQIYDYKIYTSNGPNINTRGVVTLIKNNHDVTHISNMVGYEGRFLHIQTNFQNKTYNFLNLYSPNEYKEKAPFYDQIYMYIKEIFNVKQMFSY